MRKFLAILLTLSMLTMMIGPSLAEAGDESTPTVVVKDVDGTTIYEGAFYDGVFDDYSETADSFEVTGDVDESLWFDIGGGKLIINGVLKGMLGAAGEDSSVAVVGGIQSENYSGVSAYDSTTVTVDGDITGGYEDTWTDADGEEYTSYSGQGIYATENATVIAGGNVTGEGNGISAVDHEVYSEEDGTWTPVANSANVTVDGDVTANHGTAIQAQGESTVTVGGNATGEYSGISAEDFTVYNYNEEDDTYTPTTIINSATVTVDGDVTANEGTAVYAEGESAVAIGGNVTGGDEYTWTDEDGEEYTSYSGSGIIARDNATVTAGGNVTGESYGVSAENNWDYNEETGTSTEVPNSATVTVAGDVTANHGTGVYAEGESTVTVGGNVTGGYEYTWTDPYGQENTSYSGNGINVTDKATLTVGGNVTGESYGIYAEDNWVWNEEKDTWTSVTNSTTVTVDGNVTANHGTAVNVEGDGTVTIGGDVTGGYEYTRTDGDGKEHTYYSGGGIDASENATVTVGGNVTGGTSGIATSNTYGYNEETGDYDTIANTVTVTVDGNVTANHGTAIRANGESSITVGGDVTGSGESSWTDEDGTVHTYPNGNGISVTEKAEVIVEGNVTGSANGISAYNNTWEYVDDEWTLVPDTATVSVVGNVTGGTTAINVEGNHTISVGGDVTGKEIGISIWDNEIEKYDSETDEVTYVPVVSEATVIVGGDVTAEKRGAIVMNSDATVKVAGDVTGGDFADEEEEGEEEEYEPSEEEKAYWDAYDKAYEEAWQKTFGEYADRFNGDEEGDYVPGAVQINSDGDQAKGELIVEGTIKANGESVPLVINLSLDVDESKGEIPDLAEVLPEMKVYEIDPNNGEYFQVNATLSKRDVEFSFVNPETGEEETHRNWMGTGVLTGEERMEVVETLAKTIQYIIKVINPENGEIDLEGATYDADNDLMLAHEDDKIAVRVKASRGYKVSGVDAGKVAELIDNGDGTWTVIVKRGGGVTITAKITRSAGKGHPALGKTIVYGHYDMDGDGTAEELTWICTKVMGGYAKLVMISGFDTLPDDFNTAFTTEEMEGIQIGEITQLDEKETAKRFGDGKVHPVINVKLDKIGY